MAVHQLSTGNYFILTNLSQMPCSKFHSTIKVNCVHDLSKNNAITVIIPNQSYMPYTIVILNCLILHRYWFEFACTQLERFISWIANHLNFLMNYEHSTLRKQYTCIRLLYQVLEYFIYKYCNNLQIHFQIIHLNIVQMIYDLILIWGEQN